jgi:hypothetical protein
VHEHVGPVFLLDEAPALFIIEPLHLADSHELPPHVRSAEKNDDQDPHRIRPVQPSNLACDERRAP